MGQSHVCNLNHLVFSTKYREPFISKDIHEDLNAYMSGIFKNHDSTALLINTVRDHFHGLFLLSQSIKLEDLVKEVKRSSSIWMKKQGKEFQNFYWQGGYSCFSVSKSKKDHVERYIQNQWEHHKRVSYKEELLALLDKHNMDYDEEHLWD